MALSFHECADCIIARILNKFRKEATGHLNRLIVDFLNRDSADILFRA